MLPRSLKSKLLFTVSALVIGSGLLISLMVTQRYSKSLFEALTTQAENTAQVLSLEAVDKILADNQVALEKMLDHHMRSNPSLAYLFILKSGKILAHTFTTAVPTQLVKANSSNPGQTFNLRQITSSKGEHYLDIALPILAGMGGELRAGFFEKPYRQQVMKLWVQMSGLTLAILSIALTLTLLFVRKITRPLIALSEATQKIDKGEWDVRLQVQGQDEIGRLATSFNQMVAHLEDYTCRLEEQTLELERAHFQTRTVCSIVQEVGALRSLNEIGSYLIKTFQHILKCSRMAFLIFNDNRDLLFALTAGEVETFKEPKYIKNVASVLEGQARVSFFKKKPLSPPLIPKDFHSAAGQTIIPIRRAKEAFGCLVVSCPAECRCNDSEIEVVSVMLAQAAGVIKRAVLQEEEIRDLQSRVETSAEFGGIIGKDPKMQLIYKMIEDIAPTDATVLIQGESGTGKELVARAIHLESPRKDKPFVVINCSAYPSTLLESELFGHEKGSFTGAIRQKFGRFEQAHGGTVFLDEIGEIHPSAQIKLLRVLQTQKFERLGGEKTLSVDLRILAATNKDLLQEVKKGNFREDLYYRLNVIPIYLPPLRERRNDIPLLAGHFLQRFATEQEKEIQGFRPEAMRNLLDYHWPGNVRELENTVEHATVLAKGGRIEAADLPAAIRADSSYSQISSLPTMVDHEKQLLQDTLEECGWNKKQAAKRLGISRSTLYDKLKKYQISRPTAH
ncbi:MAG: sigma 54-interacting transcriptional regulator [Deltaproteobacteria bacterium]|nr:MAG: sigma 54-interacting transcriptional regulator [Deltaproteobacteria bacterium]